MQKITSRQFNQDVSAAKRAADNQPVQITEHGRVAYVLLKASYYQELLNKNQKVAGFLTMEQGEDIDLPIAPRVESQQLREISL